MPFDLTLLAFWAKKLVSVLILPPAGPLLLVLLGLSLARLRALAWLGLVYGLVASLPVTTNGMARWLETAPLATRASVETTGAIVILGAGIRYYAPEYGGSTVNRLALERLRFGAELARALDLPVLVSGGAPSRDIVEAPMMRDILQNEFNVPVRWTEGRSLDTRDNARYSAVMLKAAGIHRITLVTHAAHMPRARRAFEQAGLEVVPAPVAPFGNPDIDYDLIDFLPSANSAYVGWFVIHELIGNLAYRLSEPDSVAPVPRVRDQAITPDMPLPPVSPRPSGQ